ncbi:MAG: class I SAM-dependent methyltransferase [Bacteroidia bacterium]
MSCNFVFAGNIPSSEILEKHYNGYPRNNQFSEITRKRYLELLEQLEPYRKTNRIIDIGCGDGYFLQTAKEKGWDVYGTEFTTQAVENCRSLGITMFQGTAASIPAELEFDVITTFEVIEHINNGRQFAEIVFNRLRTGGVFYFTTPNFNSLSRRRLKGNWRVIEYPEHLSYYTPATLHLLLSKAGFLQLWLLTSGVSFQSRKAYKDAVSSGNLAPSEALRENIEKRFYMRWLKNTVNAVLRITSTGDTIKGFFVKPAR